MDSSKLGDQGSDRVVVWGWVLWEEYSLGRKGKRKIPSEGQE